MYEEILNFYWIISRALRQSPGGMEAIAFGNGISKTETKFPGLLINIGSLFSNFSKFAF